MEITFDRYSKRILEVLVRSDSPLTTSQIAESINITPRMVRYRIPPLNDWVEKKGGVIKVKPNFGINLEIPFSRKGHLVDDLLEEHNIDISMLPDERRDFIKLLLLICDTPVASKQIKYELGVSRVTILKDLDFVESWMKENHVQLVRKPGYGVEIQGEEGDIRNAIIAYLVAKLSGLSLAKLCRGSSVLQSTKLLKKLHPKIKTALIEYLGALDLSFAWQLTNQVENDLNHQFSENSYMLSVLYFAVIIDRLRRKSAIHTDPDESSMVQPNEIYYVAKIILDKIKHRYGVRVPNGEIEFIMHMLSGLETKKIISDTIVDIKHRQISEKTESLTREILAEISMLLHPYLLVDPNLYLELSNHIQTLWSSMRIPIKFRRDISEQIKKESPHVYSIARRAAKKIETAIGFELPETEIGLLSVLMISALERIYPPNRIMRNAIIVNDLGYETTALLKSRLSSSIPEIEIINSIGPLELLNKNLAEAEFDAIITTIELENMNIPCIHVNPLLPNSDILKIKETLNIPLKSYKDSVTPLSPRRLFDLLNIDAIKLHGKASHWTEAVEHSGLLLLNVGAIYPRYIIAMKELIIKNGPYVVSGPGIALLHARPDQGAKRTCLSFLRLEKPVDFGHKDNDPVDLVFALSAADSISPQTALYEYVCLLQDRKAMNRLRKATSKEEVLAILEDIRV